MTWRDEVRTCVCGIVFTPKRAQQRHCSAKCGTRARVTQHRTRYREEIPSVVQALSDSPTGLGDGPTMVWPERDLHSGSTPRALQGDDVQLKYYEDGYPKLPACLDRRQKPEPLAEAA